MTHVDVAFPLSGTTVPIDHGYALFGALSRVLPELHQRAEWSVHPLTGKKHAPGVFALGQHARLRLRVPTAHVHRLRPLVGKSIEIDGHTLSIGVPKIEQLRPESMLRSRVVTIKGMVDEATMAASIARQVEAVAGPAACGLVLGQRRVVAVRDRRIVGYAATLARLSAEASMLIQIHGLGGRRHMGCGVFVAVARGEVTDG